MNIKDIKVARSAFTDRVYAGKVAKNGMTWSGDKKDVTDDFHAVLIGMYAGYETEIVGNGKRYRLNLEEIKEEGK